MQLKPGTTLQSGKYRIVRTLGQGGFGITYEADQVSLSRKVAIKEFFMKDCCERDEATSRITIGTGSQRELVEKFRNKFVREAQMIAALDHPHIVRVLDVFEENETAYYVMENLPGGSLTDKIRKDGPLSEPDAAGYIRQVADALGFLHSQKLLHLDVKPSNILLNRSGAAVLIDFGISKHYDSDGEQTSSTPVGLSKGYAPLEQGRAGDVAQFTPATDIYALGATLYYLVTDQTPPEASIVNEDGLGRPEGISNQMWKTIELAMQPRRKDRPQSVDAFVVLLDAESAPTEEDSDETIIPIQDTKELVSEPNGKMKLWGWGLVTFLILVLVTISLLGRWLKAPVIDEPFFPADTLEIEQSPSILPPSHIDKPGPFSTTFGSIKISSTPVGAIIWLDGNNTHKQTPETLNGIPAGEHTVRLVLDGYEENVSTLQVTSSQCTNSQVSLLKNSAEYRDSIVRAIDETYSWLTTINTNDAEITEYNGVLMASHKIAASKRARLIILERTAPIVRKVQSDTLWMNKTIKNKYRRIKREYELNKELDSYEKQLDEESRSAAPIFGLG